MTSEIYRYFKVDECEIPQIISACEITLGKYKEMSEKLSEKYGLYKFMIYRNSGRSERARKRGVSDPSEHMDVLVLFKKTDEDRNAEAEIGATFENKESLRSKFKKTQRKAHPGFTSLNGSGNLLGDDYMLYKIDLRKREGKEIFDEFIELYKLNPEELKTSQFIANCFDIQFTLVPNRSDKETAKFAYYETFGERIGDGHDASWIFAVPVYSKVYTSVAGNSNEDPLGLTEDFYVSPPFEEICKDEYLELRAKQ